MKLIKKLWIILRILFGFGLTKKQAVFIFNEAANLIASKQEHFMCLAIFDVFEYFISDKITSIHLAEYGFTGTNFANYVRLYFPSLASVLASNFSYKNNAWIYFNKDNYAKVMEAKVQFLRHLAEINSN